MKDRHIYQKFVDKGRLVASFCRHTRTPLALSLDTLWLKRGPFVAVSGDGLRLRIKPRSGESFTFYEIMVRHDYLNDGITLRPGATVVDIGANIGAFAVMAASIVGPRGRVIAFEPIPETFERLRENVALSGLGQVECRRAAIDAEEGEIALRVTARSSQATAHRLKWLGDDQHARTETAPCLTLNRVFEEYQIDRINLLKVDCEGSEYGIFDSLDPGLAARIDQVAMEVHAVEGKSPERLGERLRTLGFDLRCGYPWVAFNAAGHPAGDRVG